MNSKTCNLIFLVFSLFSIQTFALNYADVTNGNFSNDVLKFLSVDKDLDHDSNAFY